MNILTASTKLQAVSLKRISSEIGYCIFLVPTHLLPTVPTCINTLLEILEHTTSKCHSGLRNATLHGGSDGGPHKELFDRRMR